MKFTYWIIPTFQWMITAVQGFQLVTHNTATFHYPTTLSLGKAIRPNFAFRSKRALLYMGLFDSLSNFLQSRTNDFLKLSDVREQEFGPGPILLVYGIPPGILDEELLDIIDDEAPVASRKSPKIFRIDSNSLLLDLELRDALEKIYKSEVVSTQEALQSSNSSTVPVLYFSGFRNDEMLNVYQALGKEIYDETGGQSNPACAMAVPNAMPKPLRQVLEEILGDHQAATTMDE